MKSSCSGRGSCMGADRTRHSPIDQRNPPPLRTCGENLGITPHPRKKNPGRTRVPPGFCILAPKPAMPGDHPVPAQRLHGLRQVTVIPASILREFTRHAAPQTGKNPGRTRVPPGLACSRMITLFQASPQTVRRRRSTRPPRKPPTTSTAMVCPGSGTAVPCR